MANGLYGTSQSAPRLNQTALRPAGIPSSTFVRAQDESSNSGAARDLDALAKALGMLNSGLNNYADVRESIRQDPQTKDNKEWVAKRSQMSYDDLRKEVDNNTADGVKVREDAINSLLGDKAYTKFRSDWTEFYNTEFDRINGDLEGDFERKRQEFAANLPDDVSRGRFYNLTEKSLESWSDVNTKERVEFATEQVQTAVLDSFRNILETGKTSGKTPEELSKQLFEASAGNRTFLKFSGQQQNETLFQIAKEAAQNGDVGLVKAILDGKRVDADGKSLPSLRETASYASKAITLIEGAQNSKINKNTEENTKAYIDLNSKVASGSFSDEDAIAAQKSGLWTAQQAASARQQSKNNLASIQNKYKAEQEKLKAKEIHYKAQDDVTASTLAAMDDVSGATYLEDVEIPNEAGTGVTSISRDKRIKMAVDEKENQFNDYEQKLMDAGQSADDAKLNADKVRLSWYSNNNVENKTWTDMFNGAASRMTVETLTKNPETSKVFTQQLDTYRNLKHNNPAYLDKFVTDKKSKEFLEYFDNAVTYGRLPTHDAAIAAATWASQGEIAKTKNILPTSSVEKISKRVLSDLDLDNDTSINKALVASMIETQSKVGVPEGNIRDLVSKQLKDNSIEINGVLVQKSKDLPEDFGPLLMQSLDAVAERVPDARGSIDSSDMIVTSSPNEGVWIVRQKSNPTRVLAAITPENLDTIRQDNLKARNEILTKQYEAQKGDADYIKSQLPELEKTRGKYVAGQQSYIKSVRSRSKEAGDYWDKQANGLEKNLIDFINKDNAATLRTHKIMNTIKEVISAPMAEPPSLTKTSKPKKSNGIVGIYNENLNNKEND